jgi:hypothetical protein
MKIPITFVKLIQVGTYGICSAITAYVAVGATIFLYADNGHVDAIKIWQAIEFGVLVHDSTKLVRVQYGQCVEYTVGNRAKV